MTLHFQTNERIVDFSDNFTERLAKSNVSTIAASDTSIFYSWFRPWGIVVDSSGNTYASDPTGNRIYKITPSGIATTYAGTDSHSGYSGSNDGQGNQARFNEPRGLAIDSSGNIYVADERNNLIRKISSSGYVSTYAGTGEEGADNGPRLSATFNSPYGVAVDSSGNVYVADRDNSKIRKIDSSGIVNDFASISYPNGVVIDSQGNVFSDSSGDAIVKFDQSGNETLFAGRKHTGGYQDGLGELARFSQAKAIAIDSTDNIFVADRSNNRIRKVDRTGYVTTISGTEVSGDNDGPIESAQFSSPYGIAVILLEISMLVIMKPKNQENNNPW